MAEGSDFFQPWGTLSPDAPSYVERPADDELVEALARGELCLVLAPRQTGKSSLMVRAARRLAERGVRTAIIDLQRGVEEPDPDRFFNTLIARVGRELNLKTKAAAWAAENGWLSPTERFARFLQDVALAEAGGATVALLFDEIESSLKLPFSDDFFTTIRSLYNARATEPELRRLTFAFFGAVTKSSFIKDHTRTPFNVGAEIALTDFDRAGTEPFRRVLGDSSGEIINRIFYWTSGQPFLVQSLSAAAHRWPSGQRTPGRLDDEVKRAFFECEIERDTHLRFIRDYLLSDPSLLHKVLSTYGDVLDGNRVPEDRRSKAQDRLRLAGVVRAEGGRLVPRNRVYSTIFDRQWVRENTPTTPLLRPRYLAFAGSAALFVWLALMFLQLALQAARPYLFPKLRMPEQEIVTPAPSYEMAFAAEDAVRALLDGRELPITGGVVRVRFTNLPRGQSQHTLKLEGWRGFVFKESPLNVSYYPGWEVRQLNAPRPGPGGGEAGVEALAFSQSGSRLAAGVHGSVKVWEAGTGNMFQALANGAGRVSAVGFSPDGRRLASCGGREGEGAAERTLRLWDIDGGRLLQTATLARPLFAVGFSPYGTTLAVAGSAGLLELRDPVTLRLRQTLVGHRGNVTDLAFSGDGRLLASASALEGVRLWDTRTGGPIRFPDTQGGDYASVAFSPDGKLLAATESRNNYSSITLWSLQKNEPVRRAHTFDKHTDAVTGLAFSPDGRTLASGAKDKTVRLWDVSSGALRSTFEGHADWVLGVAFSPDGRTVASSSRDGAVKLWWAAARY